MSAPATSQKPQRPRVPVIIDTDPGIDDSMALLLALSPLRDEALVDLDVIALTIVHGNSNNVELLGRNACHVLDLAGRPDIPVYLGCDKPLVGPKLLGAPHVHGDNAVGDVPIPEPSTRPVPKQQCSAPEFIAKTCRARPGEIVIISLGPMTNLAAALALDSELPKFVKRVVSMGGVVAQPGNITPLSEANVCNDPTAAHMVLNAGWEVTLAPLNVTHLFILTLSDVERMGTLSKAGKFVHDITQFYLRFYKKFFKRRDFIAVHDSTAIMSVVAPHLFTHCRKVTVNVETQGEFTRGVCVADLRFDSASPREPYTVFLDGRPVAAPVPAPAASDGVDTTLVAQVEQQHADHKEAIAALVSNDKDGNASPTSSNAVAALSAETYMPSDGKVTLLLGVDSEAAKDVLFKKLQHYGF